MTHPLPQRPERRRGLSLPGVWLALAAVAVVGVPNACAQQITGTVLAHDPSTVLFEDGRYYYFNTGDYLDARSSADLSNWTEERSPFTTIPSWIYSTVTDGTLTYSGSSLWAPDVIKVNDLYYLYYSASIWGTKLSAIGYATSPTLDPDEPGYGWTDRGMVISSNHSSNYNAIDPSVMLDSVTNRLWMTWGSFNAGIFVMELNPATGQKLGPGIGVNVAAPGETHEIEGAAMMQRDGYYYLFTNWGGCCSGVDSTYNLRVGRSTSPTGPFLDRSGVNMTAGGGTLFLDDDGRKIGPGHFSYFEADGQDKFSYHYYDGNRDGYPTFGIHDIYWTADGWPKLAAVDSSYVGAGTDWTNAAGWTDGIPNGVGQIANFSSPSGRSRLVTLGSAVTVGTINFRGTVPFTLGANAESPAITLDDLSGEDTTINVAAGTHTILARVQAQKDLGVNVTPVASKLTLGAFTAPVLNKYGAGTLAVAGAASTTGGVFVRNGLLEVTGSIATNSFSSIGQIVGEEGRLRLAGGGSLLSRGDLNIGDSGDSVTPATGALEINDNASLVVQSGALYVGSGFYANSQAVGSIHQTGGALDVQNTSLGALVLGGRNSSNTSGEYVLSGGTASITGGAYVGGRGAGVLHLSGNSVMTVQRGVTIANSSSSTGEVFLDGGVLATTAVRKGSGTATLSIDGGAIRALTTTSNLIDSAIVMNLRAGGLAIDTNGYDVTLARSITRDPALGRTADGGLVKTGAGVLTLSASSDYSGPTVVSQGTLLLGNASGRATGWGNVTVHASATLGGSGTYGGALTVENGGVLAPSGVLRGSGANAAFKSGAVLSLDVGGLIAGSGFDVFSPGATSDLTLEPGALLEVTLRNAFTPALGDRFTIVSAGTISGVFEGLNLPALAQGLAFDVVYGVSDISLLVVDSALAGDYNADGVVDAADYTVWRDGGAPVGGQPAYDVWAGNYGASTSPASRSVPEPTGIVLLTTVCLGVSMNRRFARRRGLLYGCN